MFNFGQLVHAVQKNCHISDAQYAGNYTMCTYLLKMREYYRWEHDIPLSSPIPKDDIGSWLVEREQHWEDLENNNFTPLMVDDDQLDPFDSQSINDSLLKHGYVYSSGYGVFNKPLFFLGELYKHEDHGDVKLYVSACEYARDLSAPPAMLQGDTIYIRFESLRRSIWERIEEWRWRQDPEHALYHSVKAYGLDLLDGDINRLQFETLLDAISDTEIDTIVQHELGEAQAGKKLGGRWQEMLLGLAGSKAEFIARAARDHLADSLVTLPYLLEENSPAQIHYYFSNFSSIRRGIWPQLYDAYLTWRNSGSSELLTKETIQGSMHWHKACEKLLDTYQPGVETTAKKIEQSYASMLA
jgi:hypothetical protein